MPVVWRYVDDVLLLKGGSSKLSMRKPLEVALCWRSMGLCLEVVRACVNFWWPSGVGESDGELWNDYGAEAGFCAGLSRSALCTPPSSRRIRGLFGCGYVKGCRVIGRSTWDKAVDWGLLLQESKVSWRIVRGSLAEKVNWTAVLTYPISGGIGVSV